MHIHELAEYCVRHLRNLAGSGYRAWCWVLGQDTGCWEQSTSHTPVLELPGGEGLLAILAKEPQVLCQWSGGIFARTCTMVITTSEFAIKEKLQGKVAKS